jgi:hypothetical protein
VRPSPRPSAGGGMGCPFRRSRSGVPIDPDHLFQAISLGGVRLFVGVMFWRNSKIVLALRLQQRVVAAVCFTVAGLLGIGAVTPLTVVLRNKDVVTAWINDGILCWSKNIDNIGKCRFSDLTGVN